MLDTIEEEVMSTPAPKVPLLSRVAAFFTRAREEQSQQVIEIETRWQRLVTELSRAEIESRDPSVDEEEVIEICDEKERSLSDLLEAVDNRKKCLLAADALKHAEEIAAASRAAEQAVTDYNVETGTIMRQRQLEFERLRSVMQLKINEFIALEGHRETLRQLNKLPDTILARQRELCTAAAALHAQISVLEAKIAGKLEDGYMPISGPPAAYQFSGAALNWQTNALQKALSRPGGHAPEHVAQIRRAIAFAQQCVDADKKALNELLEKKAKVDAESTRIHQMCFEVGHD